MCPGARFPITVIFVFHIERPLPHAVHFATLYIWFSIHLTAFAPLRVQRHCQHRQLLHTCCGRQRTAIYTTPLSCPRSTPTRTGMAGLKSYFSPSRASNRRNRQPSIEMSSSSSTTPSATPRSSPLSPSHDFWSHLAPAHTSPHYSRHNSGRNSPHPVGDFRNGTTKGIADIKCEVMVEWLHAQQEEHLWTIGQGDEGVMLKKGQGEYSCAPGELRNGTGGEGMGFFDAVAALNVRVSRWMY